MANTGNIANIDNVDNIVNLVNKRTPKVGLSIRMRIVSATLYIENDANRLSEQYDVNY